MNIPYGIALDRLGNLYVVEYSGSRVREVAAGTITTVAGTGAVGYTGDNGLATAATFTQPWGIAVDAAGNIYIGDHGNKVIREITASNGKIGTIAGTGTAGFSGDGGPALSAELNWATDVALDSNRNIYIADHDNNRIRVIGSVTTPPTITWATPSPITYPTALSSTQLDASSGGISGAFTYSPAAGSVPDAGIDMLVATFTPTDLVDYNVVTANVLLTVNPATPSITWSNPAAITYGTALGGTQLNATASVAGSFVYTPPAGVVLPAGANSLTVAFTPTSGDYAPVTYTVPITVNKATPTLSFDPIPNQTFGDSAFTVTASSVSGGAVTYSVTSGPASVSGSKVTLAGAGTVVLAASQAATSNYSAPANASVSFTVRKAPPTVTWANPAGIAHGTALSSTQLDATASVAGTFAYSPAAGTVLSSGPHPLSVTFTPTDTTDYTNATADATIVVSSASGTLYDIGTVKLTVNGSQVASANYGQTSTPSSIAEALAASASSTLVNVFAVDDAIYVESKAGGASTNYPYMLQTTSWDSTDFPSQPSFLDAYSGASPQWSLSGNLMGASAGGSSQGQVDYTYQNVSFDYNGNVTGFSDSVMGTWTFGYDTLNRLSSSHNTAATTSSAQYLNNYGCWVYDAFGNQTSEAMSATACNSNPPLTSWGTLSASNNNRFASTQNGATHYDASGNVSNDGVNTYLYDGEGRVCAVSYSVAGATLMTGYVYDADGIRVAKGSINTWSCDLNSNGFQTLNSYVLGPGGEQVTEMGMDSNGSMVWQHTNIYTGSSMIGTYDLSGLHFFVDDPLGTRRAQTDYAGVLEQTCASLPYGDQLNCSGPLASLQYPTEQHFTGKERDAESGNDYFGARYYASSMGRWLSPDKPFADQHPEDPQSWNLYAYVRNNPLVAIDDNGEGTRPAQSQYINAALGTDPTLNRVILASNNFSPGGFEDAYNSGGLNNLNVGAGNTLRGLAGEATVLDDINKTGFWSLIQPGAASPSPSNLAGVHPDVGVMYDPTGFVLQNVANSPGGAVEFGSSVVANYMEVKSGLSASSIDGGVTQAVNTASAINAAGLGGKAISTLLVDAGAWNSLTDAQRAAYSARATKGGAYIQVQPGLADAARKRAQQLVDAAKKKQQGN